MPDHNPTDPLAEPFTRDYGGGLGARIYADGRMILHDAEHQLAVHPHQSRQLAGTLLNIVIALDPDTDWVGMVQAIVDTAADARQQLVAQAHAAVIGMEIGRNTAPDQGPWPGTHLADLVDNTTSAPADDQQQGER